MASVLTNYITSIHVPRLRHRCEVYPCHRVLMFTVNSNVFHVADEVSLLILATKIAPTQSYKHMALYQPLGGSAVCLNFCVG